MPTSALIALDVTAVRVVSEFPQMPRLPSMRISRLYALGLYGIAWNAKELDLIITFYIL